VNGLDTMWVRDDVQAAATSGAHGVAIPKVQSADDVQRAAAMLQGSGAPESLALWAMIESPQAVIAVADIARASPMLAGLIVGTNDLAKDLHCTHPADRWTMMVALQQCVLGARAAGIVVLDGVHLDLEDEAGLATACRQSRDMGFDGKTLIHPKQIDAANAAFAPSAAELDRARRIVAAYEDATSKGQAVTLVDGRLIEGLHVLEAQRLLAQADAINALQ
jgi:citrate lyase subunit beta/citryl-CoA lyase